MKNLNNLSISVAAKNIEYSDATFMEIVVREICKDGDPTGQYHIKPIKSINLDFLIEFIGKEIMSAKIIKADPENYLNLEFPLFMESHEDRSALIMKFHNVDKALVRFFKDRSQ